MIHTGSAFASALPGDLRLNGEDNIEFPPRFEYGFFDGDPCVATVPFVDGIMDIF